MGGVVENFQKGQSLVELAVGCARNVVRHMYKAACCFRHPTTQLQQSCVESQDYQRFDKLQGPEKE